MSDIKWIKVVTDMFDNRKIKQIETLPEGDAIIVIWLKLLCLAGNVNEQGLVYFTKEIPYTEEMMSTEFHRPINTVRLALKTFEQFGMIEIINDIIMISNWEKYQNIEGLDKVREQTRLRVQKHRAKQKLLACNDSNVTGNVTVTKSNATEEELDKEIETDIDIEGENRNKESLSSSYRQVLELYSSICVSYPKLRSLSESRKKAIRARLSTYSMADFETVFRKAEASDFMKGKNKRDWRANFDWMMKDANFGKILEGTYDTYKAQDIQKDPQVEKQEWLNKVKGGML